MTIMELEQEVGISHRPIHAILSDDLKMRRVSAKFVLRQLTTDQLECRMMVDGKAFLSSPDHHTVRISLRVDIPYSENGHQGDAFRNHGGHQIECDGRTPEDSKRSLLPVLPTMARSMEQTCVCARVLL